MDFLKMITSPEAFLTGFFCALGATLVYFNHTDAGMVLIGAAVSMGQRLIPSKP